MMKRYFYILVLLFACVDSHSQVTRHYNIILRSNTGTDTLYDGNVVKIYGFAFKLSEFPKLPAKTIYANEGDTVILNAQSISQGDHHSIHLHGLDVDTRNDGDPATSFQLSHMQDTTYTFIAKHAGTYLYHCHVADVVHVQMGMYGLVVVKAKDGAKTAWTGGPSFQKDYNWLMSELDKAWHDSVPVHDTINETVDIPMYKPTYFLVNGKSQQQILNDDSTKIIAQTGQSVYLRLGNIGFYDNQVVFPSSLNAKMLDSDGRPLPNQVQSDTVYVSPGERYGVMLSPSTVMNDNIAVNYMDMNTQLVKHTELVPVNISLANAVEEIENKSVIKIYPNPAKDQITLGLPNELMNKKIQVDIFNYVGQCVISQLLNEGETTIDIKSISEGLYICNMSIDQKMYTQKLLIIK